MFGITCATGFGNCDGLLGNGCETNTGVTVTSCGACGAVCAPANATPACAGGGCGVGVCNPSFGNCDGLLSGLFAAGIKGRYKEDRYAEHKLIDTHFAMDVLEGGKVVHKDVPMRNALNEVLRTEYIKDCQRGVDRWNKTIKDEGVDFEIELPSHKFHRQIGMWSTQKFTPDG